MSAAVNSGTTEGPVARVVLITEADKMDEAKQASRETSPPFQLKARTSSFGENALFYGECTVSVAEGFIYQRVMAG